MTKAQARQLILVLSAKRIPFRLRREQSSYIVAFDQRHVAQIALAIGA